MKASHRSLLAHRWLLVEANISDSATRQPAMHYVDEEQLIPLIIT